MVKNYDGYNDWKHLIKEGDVLLFKGVSFWSRFVKMAGNSVYSHVGVASWHDDILECVEFNERYGGRSINLENYIKLDDKPIDVYRPIPFFSTMTWNEKEEKEIVTRSQFNGRMVTNAMRGLTGMPYGWRRIWWIIKRKTPILRFFQSQEKTSVDEDEIIYPVCSTSLAYCFSMFNWDVINNRADQWTEPGDFGLSTRLCHVFSINPEGILRTVS